MNEYEPIDAYVMDWMFNNMALKIQYACNYRNNEGLSSLHTNEERKILIQLIELSEGIYNGND